MLVSIIRPWTVFVPVGDDQGGEKKGESFFPRVVFGEGCIAWGGEVYATRWGFLVPCSYFRWYVVRSLFLADPAKVVSHR